MREGRDSAGLAATLFRGSASFLAIYVLGSAISFGVHLLIARVLGATSYGHFVYATSWMAMLLLGCHIGLRPTVVRFAAAYQARAEWGLLRGLLHSATTWTAGASVLTIAASIAALWIARPRLDELGWTLLIVILAMLPTALADLWSAALRGLGAIAPSQWPASIVQHVLVAVALLAIVGVAGTEGGAVAAAAAFLLATLGTLFAARVLLRRQVPDQATTSPVSYRRREWADVAGSNLLIALFQAVRTPLIVVIAGAYVDAQHVAYLGAAQRLVGVMSLGLLGISGFASPLISQYFALADYSRLRRLARLSALGALGAALVPALVLASFGRELLGLFGDGFPTAYATLLILMAGEVVAAAAGPVGHFLTMTGRQKIATWIEAIAGALVLGIALILIPRHGILGAAIAVATGNAFRNLAMSLAVRWKPNARSRTA